MRYNLEVLSLSIIVIGFVLLILGSNYYVWHLDWNYDPNIIGWSGVYIIASSIMLIIFTKIYEKIKSQKTENN